MLKLFAAPTTSIGWRCPACSGSLPSVPPPSCERCRQPIRHLMGGIYDFVSTTDSPLPTLNWSEEVWRTIQTHADHLRNYVPISPNARALLTEAGVTRADGVATELGNGAAYHMLEREWQKNGDILRSWLLESTQLSASSRLLDVGCGAGHTLRYLHSVEPAQCVGIDFDLNALSIGIRIYGSNQDIQLVRGDACSLPFQTESFTHVISRVAINYVHQATALREMVRVLEPGGYLAVRFESWNYDLIQMHTTSRWLHKVSRSRELISGTWLALSGTQLPLNKWFGFRHFASAWRVGRWLRRLGCDVMKTSAVPTAAYFHGRPTQMAILARKK